MELKLNGKVKNRSCAEVVSHYFLFVYKLRPNIYLHLGKRHSNVIFFHNSTHFTFTYISGVNKEIYFLPISASYRKL